MITKKLVNIYPSIPILEVNPPIRSIVKSTYKTIEQIRVCIIARATVEEILPNGKTIRLNFTNYDKDNSGEAAVDPVDAVKQKVSISGIPAPVDEPVDEAEEAPVEESVEESSEPVDEAEEAPVEESVVEEEKVIEEEAEVTEDVEVIEDTTTEDVAEVKTGDASADIAKMQQKFNNKKNKRHH